MYRGILILAYIFFSTPLLYGITTVSNPVFTKGSYERYEKAEATFTISFNGGNYSNPYDSSIVSADAIITLPDLSTQIVPCFYYIPATISGGTITELPAQAKWMLRYAPTQAGSYTVRIRVVDANGTVNSGNATFTSIASTRKGFVRINSARTQFMKFDNGTAYYPIGFNLAWNNGSPATFYNSYVTNMGSNKCTWMRYWLVDFARQALEWTNNASYWGGYFYGLGKYTQGAAAILDTALNVCEQQGVYMQLVLQHHGQVSTGADPEWNSSGGGQPGNPYNSINGGPVPQASPGQWFTNTSAMAYQKKHYRYVVARWGYSANILAWELFNEVEFSDGADADIDSWHNTMSRYLKERDVNKHIVTTSCGGDNSVMPLLDDNAYMDNLQYHIYAGSPIEKNTYALGQSLAAATNKPVWCGEFGISGSYPGVASGDDWGDHVRKTMWIGMFSEVPAMFWYWDTYIDTKNLYSIFKPLGTFLTGVDIVGETGGVYKDFDFANNPSITGTVTASPGNANWGFTNIPNPWSATVDGNGDITGLDNLCVYLHGSWQGTRSREASFIVNFQSAGTAVVNLSSSSGSGTNSLQIFVDGSLSNTWSIPNNSGGTYSVPVSAGTHTIRFYSNGQDWLQVNNFQFNNAGLKTLKAYGYTGTTKAYGYVYDQSRPQWQDPAVAPSVATAQIKIGPLTPGTYQVDFFDPQFGTAFFSGGTYSTINDSITVPIPSFKKDIAFKVYPDPLPVKFGSFNGYKQNEQVVLNWNTYEEIHNDHFVIERSSDGKVFNSIGTVKGSGNSSSVVYYSFIDKDPLDGNNYYRLVQVDTDDKKEYSKIILIDFNSAKIELFPNPATDMVSIRFTSKTTDDIQLSIFNTLGQEVLLKTLSCQAGFNEQSLSIAFLQEGLYVVRFSTGESITFVKE